VDIVEKVQFIDINEGVYLPEFADRASSVSFKQKTLNYGDSTIPFEQHKRAKSALF
jgi:hypothetical protein